ncbi:MAG TPA: pyrroline-5-carboxylate reductase dimerization domain-containing protein, partial [Burkholderiaceae bacterium]|nr:pyrroline-5-carboxylate reductase dimerization domain-containing protein [Burkholderiaceae bacterium]
LDAVTAVSGSGPAYVFYFIEALIDAGRQLGFTEAQARTLAIATFTGAAELAARSDEPVAVLRERVTSKGGTTAAALASLEKDGVNAAIVRAVAAAQRRAVELGDEFGR